MSDINITRQQRREKIPSPFRKSAIAVVVVGGAVAWILEAVGFTEASKYVIYGFGAAAGLLGLYFLQLRSR